MDVPVFFKSNRGARKMNFKEFQYPMDRQTGTEPTIKIYWRCENRNCKGRITTVNDVTIRETAHDMHIPSKQEVEIQKSMACLKEITGTSQEAPSRLVNRELQDAFPPEYRDYWPKEATIKRQIQKCVGNQF